MAHLEDRLAEFFYGELSPADMTDARRHIGECADCRLRVEQFRMVDAAVRTVPEMDPPRHVVLLPQERRAWVSWFDLRWAVAGSAVAILLASVVIGALFRTAPLSVSVPNGAPVVIQAEKIDYSRIVNEVRESERAWVANELVKRDQEIQRLRGELAYYENFQRAVVKETLENGSTIQLLAQRVEFQR